MFPLWFCTAAIMRIIRMFLILQDVKSMKGHTDLIIVTLWQLPHVLWEKHPDNKADVIGTKNYSFIFN